MLLRMGDFFSTILSLFLKNLVALHHWLEEGKVYNVKSGTWHTLFMMPGSKLAVIENRDTSVANSPRYYFSDEERANLIPEINSI